jgi:hypothetical protein
MKIGQIAWVVAVAALTAAGVGLAMGSLPGSPPPAASESAPAAPDPVLARRMAALEARLDELAAGMERMRKEAADARAEEQKREEVRRKEDEGRKEQDRAVKDLIAAAASESGKKPQEADPFSKAIAKGMRQGIRQEFRKIWDLVVSPSPEALDQRRRQLKMFAGMFGNGAGLDQAQIATLERILNETDEKARDELRPMFQGVEDYHQLDYVKVKKVTEDSFATQNDQFDKEFPKEKSDRLKAQLEPVRTIFGAMIDELDKESKAPQQPAQPEPR